MQRTFKGTKAACYAGYFVQAIINNLTPILFVIFNEHLGISLEIIGSLILVNFITQMFVDILSVKIVDKIGYKKIIVTSHIFAFVGLLMLGILPQLTQYKFAAICASIIISAMGSGMIEVTISPVVESIPSNKKAADMSLLHSFYCWGQMVVVALSTIFIYIVGSQFWFVLPIIWSLIPLINMFNFLSVPFMPTVPDEIRTPIKNLLKSKSFIVAMIIMLCAGASELAMSQWSSYFAETGLGISKLMGDLLGPCLFAVFMGMGRLLFGLKGDKMNLIKSMLICAVLCIVCYLTTSISDIPLLSLFACALTGLSISLFWPGSFSIVAKMFPNGGAGMFGVLAIMGDIGCGFGPWIISLISTAAKTQQNISDGSALKFSLGFGAIFPVIIIIGLIIINKTSKKHVDKDIV